MKPAVAQNLRRVGLAIEAVCLLALLTVAKQKIEPKVFLGIERTRWIMGGLAIGFVFWFVGTASYYWPNKKPD